MHIICFVGYKRNDSIIIRFAFIVKNKIKEKKKIYTLNKRWNIIFAFNHKLINLLKKTFQENILYNDKNKMIMK